MLSYWQNSFNFVGESELSHDEEKLDETQELDATTSNMILVGYIPEKADEKILELFFESKKKVDGGSVKNIHLNRKKHWAIIAFDNPESVEVVICKKPITLMDRELDTHPYIPLLQGDMWIDGLELHGLPKELTEELMSKDIEGRVRSAEG